jgi:hypothetical protein
MKYIVKWNNGYWKVFDTVQYTDVAIKMLKTEADATAKKMNLG